MLERLHQNGRHESIVNHQQRAEFFADFCDACNVGDFLHGVRDTLNPHNLGILLEMLTRLGQILEVDHVPIDAGRRRENVPDVTLGAAIHIIVADEVVALLK